MNEGKPDLETVEQYLNDHFFPILERIQGRIEDPQLVAVALRSTTRHIFHWQQDRNDRIEAPREPEQLVEASPPAEGAPGDDGPRRVTREEAYEAAKHRAPDEWVSGDQPATPKQLAVLRDRAIPHAGAVTKAEASKLITQHVYGGARA